MRGAYVWHRRGMDMSAFIAELEARFDDERGRDLDALIDELTDAERASVTLSARLAPTSPKEEHATPTPASTAVH